MTTNPSPPLILLRLFFHKVIPHKLTARIQLKIFHRKKAVFRRHTLCMSRKNNAFPVEKIRCNPMTHLCGIANRRSPGHNRLHGSIRGIDLYFSALRTSVMLRFSFFAISRSRSNSGFSRVTPQPWARFTATAPQGVSACREERSRV